MLQQLRTGGIAYRTPPEGELGERAATMSRIQGRKGGRERPRVALLGVLSQGASDEALLSEGRVFQSNCLWKYLS